MTSYLRAHGIATLALFVALGTGAYAAATIDSGDVKNNSLTSKDLKKNKGVKSGDVKDGNLTGKDVKDDSIGGADVNEADLKLTRIVARFDSAPNVAVPGNATETIVPIPGSWVQKADELDEVRGTFIAQFPADCDPGPSRSFAVYITRAGTPTLSGPADDPLGKIVAIGQAMPFDNPDAGAVSVLGILSSGDYLALTGLANNGHEPGADTTRSLEAHLIADCNAGTGAVTLTALHLDVVGHR